MVSTSKARSIARRVRLARRAAGISRRQAAKALGIPRGAYACFERSLIMPGGLLVKFCALTRVSPEYLLRGEQFDPHQSKVLRSGNLVTKLNMCGAPCPYGHFWCDERCLHR